MALTAKMVNIGHKKATSRIAVACGDIILKKETLRAIKERNIKKGDVFTVSQIAGIQAIKNTWNILSLCHQIPLHSISIDFISKKDRITSVCTVITDYKTGVEMEALLGVSIALLSIWDMVKYIEKDNKGQYPKTSITNIRILKKISDRK